MAADAGTTAGMAGQEARSTAGLKIVKTGAEREEIWRIVIRARQHVKFSLFLR